MPRRTNGGQDLSPQDEKLLQLQQLQGAGQQQDEASNNETAGLVKMLSELYGLHEHQQIDPALLEKTQAETGLAKAHTQYYEEKPEELKSRAMAAELGGLDKAYAYDTNNPEYHTARRNVLSKYGYNLDAPAAAKPQGEFGGTGKPTVPPSPVGQATHELMKAQFRYNPITAPTYAGYEFLNAPGPGFINKLKQTAGTFLPGSTGY